MSRTWIASLVVVSSLAGTALKGAERPALEPVEKKFGPPVLWVPGPKAPPVINGTLDDPCWKDARRVTLGFSTGAWWDVPTQKTEARVLADARGVYFAVRCFEAEPKRMVTKGAARKGMVVGADAVEIFLDPDRWRKRYDYFHMIVTPDGKVYRGRGLEPDAWKAAPTVKVGKFDRGWTVEAAVPLEALGLKAGAIPRVWGLNICRQRPELAADMPKAARDAGNKRFDPPMWKLDKPDDYRLAEYTCWAPTYADFCGWPFYSDSRPFHLSERFGHAVLEVGTQDVKPPARLFEVLFRADFDDGKVGPFKDAALADDNFRGPGKCLTFAKGKNRIQFTRPLEDLDDVTILFTCKLDPQRLPVQHVSLTGRAPDGIWCGAERYEIFLPQEEAASRTKFLEEYHKKLYGDGPFRLYDTHADMVRWKPCGGVRKGPGPWAMVEGFFAEPSGGQVRWPGKEWVIVRIRPGLFRRAPQPKQGQKLVPPSQNYPDGLTLGASPRDGFRLDDVVIFRGTDTEPPERVRGVKLRRTGDDVEVSWERAKDNTLTAFYRIYAGKKLVAESHRLKATLKASAVGDAGLTVVAVDLYGNVGLPSVAARIR
jgi:hypothetical protein